MTFGAVYLVHSPSRRLLNDLWIRNVSEWRIIWPIAVRETTTGKTHEVDFPTQKVFQFATCACNQINKYLTLTRWLMMISIWFHYVIFVEEIKYIFLFQIARNNSSVFVCLFTIFLFVQHLQSFILHTSAIGASWKILQFSFTFFST